MTPYLEDLSGVIDLEAVAAAGISIGVDPMGGAAVEYWGPLADRYNLNLKVVNPVVDPTFSFMTVDIRWQNPHGLLIARRHGPPGGDERRF